MSSAVLLNDRPDHGVPLILVHGVLGSPEIFRDLAQMLPMQVWGIVWPMLEHGFTDMTCGAGFV